MTQVSNEKIEKTKDLYLVSDDLKGVREVQSIYGSMPSSQYISLVIADRAHLSSLRKQIEIAEAGLKDNEGGEAQFILLVNNANPNPVFHMDEQTKNAVIDQFKSVIPVLDDQLEVNYQETKSELDQL